MLRKALDFEIAGRRGHRVMKIMYRRLVNEHIEQMKLKKEDANDKTKWRNCVYKFSSIMR